MLGTSDAWSMGHRIILKIVGFYTTVVIVQDCKTHSNAEFNSLYPTHMVKGEIRQ